MSALEFRVLGPLEVLRDGASVPIPAPKQRALLGLLLLHANEPVAQDELIDLLWGEDAPPSVRASLQNQVHGLRKVLGPTVIERQPEGYVVHVSADELDLQRFQRLVAEARGATPKERASKLRDALACWRGPALVEFPREPFAAYEISRLEEERLTAVEERVDADLALDRHAELVAELEELVGRHPLRERLWAQLMLALYRTGRQADALAAYRRAHRTFVDDYGVEPGVVLRELQRAILVQSPALNEIEQRVSSTLVRAAAVLPAGARERAESLYEYAFALFRLGEHQQAQATFRAVERMAAEIGEAGLAERTRLFLSELALQTDGTSSIEHLATTQRASRFFKESGDDVGLAVALRVQSHSLRETGHAAEGTIVALDAAEAAARAGNRWQEAFCRAEFAYCLAVGTTPVEPAITRCEVELEKVDGNEIVSHFIWSALALLHAQAGRIDEARNLGRRAIAGARQSGAFWNLISSTWYLAYGELYAGNLTEAAGHYRWLHATLEAAEDRGAFPCCSAELACVLALRGEIAEAAPLARSGRAEAPLDDLYTEVAWRRALALVDAHEGRVGEAVRLSNEACVRAAASDHLTFRGQTLEEAAVVRTLAGDPQGAGKALRQALVTYTQKGNVVGAERVRARLNNA